MSGKRVITMQHQLQRSPAQKMYRPTKRDILIGTGMATCLMGVLSLVVSAACAQMDAGRVAWLILLATIWLPGGSLLVLFAFSRWPDPAESKETSGELDKEQGAVD